MREEPNEWYRNYLSSRAISLDTASKYGWKLIYPDDIHQMSGRPLEQCNRMEAAIDIPYPDTSHRLRPMRPPIHLEDGDSGRASDIAKMVFDLPENANWGDEWRRRTRNLDDGVHEFEGRLVKVQGQNVDRLNYYPLAVSAEAMRLAAEAGVTLKVAKFLSPRGQPTRPYIPAAIVGGRPLLIVEGETRALACLETGAEVDVVAVSGCWCWKKDGDVHPDIARAVSGATNVVIAFDGDWKTNDSVRAALVRLQRAIRSIDKDQPKDVTFLACEIPGQPKTGLDDCLAAGSETRRRDELLAMISGALPLDPWQALGLLRSEKYESADLIHLGRPRSVGDVILFASDLRLADYEDLRRAYHKEGIETPKHPAPEGKLYGVSDGRIVPASKKDIAMAAKEYILPRCGHVTMLDSGGVSYIEVDTKNACKQANRDSVMVAVSEALSVLQGFRSTVDQGVEALRQIALHPTVVKIDDWRWVSETKLAFHELPSPSAGPTRAWDEFLNRCSDADTFLAWTWTLLLPEEQTGRQALVLKGAGHDGKSYVTQALSAMMGPLACALDTPKGDHRFQLASLPGKRLAVMGDVLNTRLARGNSKLLRELLAGADLPVERKGKDIYTARLHPRVLITTNYQIEWGDRAEQSRFLQVDVAANTLHEHGDSSWPVRLLTEVPQLLYRAREAYSRAMASAAPGSTDIPLTEVTLKVMSQGQDAADERWDKLEAIIESDPAGRVSGAEMTAELEKLGYRDWALADARKWLRQRGYELKAGKVPGFTKTVKCWHGFRLVDRVAVARNHRALAGVRPVSAGLGN
jgi:Domain of unknown function (DUF3854)/Family of unknown function (DUF5906)